MSIKYSKQFLSLVNSLTPINDSVIIDKAEDKIRISRSNPSCSIFYILEANLDSFNFESEKLAFYNFPEFFQLLNVFDDPKINIDENKVIIANDKSKIRYIISDPETIKAGPKGVNFPEIDIKMTLETSEIKNLKKMISLLGSKYVKFSASEKNINFKCFNENHDNSYDKDFVLENESKTFELKISSDVFTLIPDNNYCLEISSQGIIRISYVKDDINLAVYVAQIVD
jgi:hypothetical protein